MAAIDPAHRASRPDPLAVGTVVLGVSLKMYLDQRETVAWCRQVAALAGRHPAIRSGAASLFILPSTPLLGEVRALLAGTPIRLGAQDTFHEDAGAFTGAVSPRLLRQVGCDYVAVGHAERRRIFGETSAMIALKVAAAVRNGLAPVLCVGEPGRGAVGKAAAHVLRQVGAAIRASDASRLRLLVAYEPVWAIGAARPAGVGHISGVCGRIQRYLDANPRLRGSRVIYGGSAGPGLLTALRGQPAGLFLGRFAHDPANVRRILDEVQALRRRK